MIIGILLLYIGIRFQFPVPYMFGCWFVIGFQTLRNIYAFLEGVYEAGKEKEHEENKPPITDDPLSRLRNQNGK